MSQNNREKKQSWVLCNILKELYRNTKQKNETMPNQNKTYEIDAT